MTWKTTVQRGPERRNPRRLPTVRTFGKADTGWTSTFHVFEADSVDVGRAVGAQGLAFPNDPRVSRLHARLHFDMKALKARVIDMSRTGTFVQGMRIAEADLAEGDIVRVGDSFFLFRFETEAEHEAGRPLAPDEAQSRLIGDSPALRAVRRTLSLVAKTPACVLILGESGTGKELAAHALHTGSQRPGPFVAVNCAAIPEALAESQLFGHVAGAFTGARSDAPGFFRSASAGTLFLDEVGELPLLMQPKLLRAVEERAVVPVGATRPIACDVRIVAATNRDLSDRERFRGDLLARISDFVIEMPPLRARREDILAILASLLDEPKALDPELLEALLLYAYPHNARDLRRFAMQLQVRGAERSLWELDLVDDLRRARSSMPSSREASDEAKTSDAPSAEESLPALAVPSRQELIDLLKAHRGVIADVARVTTRSRKQVYRWLEQYGLDLDEYRSG